VPDTDFQIGVLILWRRSEAQSHRSRKVHMPSLRSLLQSVSPAEKRVVRGIVAVMGLVLAFAVLAGAVKTGYSRAIDEHILLLFRVPGNPSVAIGPTWLKDAMRDITALGSTSVITIIVAGVVGFLAVSGLRNTAVLVLVSVVSGVLLSNTLKASFARTRPDLIPHELLPFSASFPSGHTTLSAVVYLTLGALLCRTQASFAVKAYLLCFALFLTGSVGVSRVYLGVHWPTDVLAGWLVGGTWALLSWFVMVWLQSRGEVEPEQASDAGKDARG